jgi:hypothetical protein
VSSSFLNVDDFTEAKRVFLDRRARIESLFDSRLFLLLGYANRYEASKAEIVWVEFGGQKREFSLPDSTKRENHSAGCRASLLELPNVCGSFPLPKAHPGWEGLAKELLRIPEFRSFVSRHGGFWWDVAQKAGFEDPRKNLLAIPGAANLIGRLPSQPSSILEFVETIFAITEPCCHLPNRACSICSMDFLPTGWTSLELNVGYDICPMCCRLATDSWHTDLWLPLDKDERLRELELGLQIGLQAKEMLPSVSGGPQYDSLKALVEAGLDSRQGEIVMELFLCVALRPKLNQIRKDFESWDAWVYRLGSEFRDTYPSSQRVLISNDGHHCFSNGEVQICNYLSSREIPHTKEPPYADLAGEFANFVGHWVGDFRVNDVIIEYAGMSGDEAYDSNLAAKIFNATQLGIEVLVIRPDDLSNLDHVLSSLVG